MCGCGCGWVLILGRYPRRSSSLVDPRILLICGNRARGSLPPRRKILDRSIPRRSVSLSMGKAPSLLSFFVQPAFRSDSNPRPVPSPHEGREPSPSSLGFPKDPPSVLFPVRKGRLDRSIGRRFPFRHVHVPRRIVFVFVPTSDVHDTCEPSTCTCKTTRGARDKERP